MTKTDAGTYQYDPTKIHALTLLTNPVIIGAGDHDVTYTKFQRPEKITAAGNELTYTYGADYERRKAIFKTNGATMYTRLYLGDLEITTRNGATQYVHYISGGDGICAIAVKEGNSAFNFYVPYTDHLGSIVTVTNSSGTVVAEQNFDAWGRNRQPNTWNYGVLPVNPTWLYRGYTGHEQLNEFNLINMNARLYDPTVGRMLSPDNVVSMGGSQGLNRYTYAYNNPTKYADPDGNCPVCIGAVIGAGVDIAIQWYTTGKINWTQVGLAAISGGVGGGVGAWIGGSAALATSSAVVQGALSGAAAGAASGFVSAWMNGQRNWDLAKTVAISAGVGAATGAAAGYLKGRFAKPKAGAEPIILRDDPASKPQPSGAGRNGKVIILPMKGQMAEINPQTGKYLSATYTPENLNLEDVGDKLVLGLHKDLNNFARAINGLTYRQFTSGGFRPDEIFAAMNNPNNTLHFNLTGFTKVQYQIRFDPSQTVSYGNITNWEIYNIYNVPGMLERTTFYTFRNGVYEIVRGPF